MARSRKRNFWHIVFKRFATSAIVLYLYNHRYMDSENLVDTNTGAHTQIIESLWKLVKSKNNTKVNGASPLLDRQLKEEWWRSFYPIQTQIFLIFYQV